MARHHSGALAAAEREAGDGGEQQQQRLHAGIRGGFVRVSSYAALQQGQGAGGASHETRAGIRQYLKRPLQQQQRSPAGAPRCLLHPLPHGARRLADLGPCGLALG